MAKFMKEIPNDLIKELEKLNKDTHQMLGKMTNKGASIVKEAVISNLPNELRNSNFAKNVKVTRTYDTPSDNGVNTKVYISGYFTNKNGKSTPAPLVANLFEYGRSTSPFPKKPFFRKSFNKGKIEKAMLEVQKEFIDE